MITQSDTLVPLQHFLLPLAFVETAMQPEICPDRFIIFLHSNSNNHKYF